MSAALLMMLTLSPAPATDPLRQPVLPDIAVLRPHGIIEELLYIEPDPIDYAVRLRDRGPGGLPLVIRKHRIDPSVGALNDPFVLKVAPWPMFVGGGLKLGAEF